MAPPVISSVGPKEGTEAVSALEVLVRNLTALTEAHGLSQSELARRAGISQKSSNNLFRSQELDMSPGIDLIEKAAAVFGLTAAELLSPSLPKEAMCSPPGSVRVARSVGRLVEDFLSSDESGRQRITAVAEEEAERARRK